MQTIRNWYTYFTSNRNSRLILLVTMGMFVMITTAGSSLYFSSKSVLQGEVSEPQIHLLRIGMEAVNTSVNTVDQIGVNILLSNLTYQFLNPAYTMQQSEIAHLVEYLDNLTVSPAVESIMLYDNKRQRVIGSTPYGFSSQISNLLDTDWQNYLTDLNPKHFTIVDRTKSNNFGFEQKIETITLFRPVVRDEAIAGVIMININKKKLFDKIFDNYTSQTDAYRFVINDNNHLIYETDNRILSQEQIASALSQNNKTFFDYGDGQDNYLISQVSSDLTGWKYVSVITQQRLLQKVTTIRNAVFGFSIISIMAGMIGIFITHHLTFKPVRRIRHLLLAGQSHAAHMENRDLEDYLLKLTTDFADVSSMIKHNRSELQTKYIHDGIAGRMSPWEMKDRWHRHFTDWTDLPLFSLLISIDRYYQWSGAYNEEDQNLLWFAIKNVCEEWMGRHYRIALVEHDLNLLLIVQKTDERQNVQHLREDLSGLLSTIHKLIHVDISAAVGEEFGDYTHLRQSCLQAELTLSYRLYNGYSTVSFFGDLQEAAESKTIDPIWRKDLLTCLDVGNEEIAVKLLDALQQYLKDARLSPAEAVTFFRQLMDGIAAYLGDHGLAKPGILRRYNSHWFDTMSLDDIIQLLVQVYKEISQLSDQRANSRDYLIVQQMIQYMKQHLHENIGVSEIADSVGLSKSSVNSIFKQEMNRTLYDYLTELRMHEAEAHLAGTDLKIADIALKVGYQNENSLIRAFRKHRSLTPGQFRDMARKQQSTDASPYLP
ncbi:helix-turn-helix domain-containing protein [Paenibacillus oryzisoli]|uniref:helix-turn-helix domain-containing protein n=1 Tax=Paenibacillus oryzisoli TaxID=1850517 RepID=UPI003D28F27A